MERRNALITGASRGLGAAIALGLAEAGFDLTISARGEPGLVSVAQAAQALGLHRQTVAAWGQRAQYRARVQPRRVGDRVRAHGFRMRA